MNRYIDTVKAAEIVSERYKIPLSDLVDTFAEVPPADVVEVVRCRDCRYRGSGDVCPMFHLCYSVSEGYYWEDFTMDNKFCSYGAKKDGDKE